MWQIFDNQPELKKEFETAIESLKDFDNQYVNDAKQCSESSCSSNGACGVPKKMWTQQALEGADSVGFEFENDSCRCQAKLGGGFLADPADKCKTCPEFSIIEKEVCKCPRFYRLNDQNKCADVRIKNGATVYIKLEDREDQWVSEREELWWGQAVKTGSTKRPHKIIDSEGGDYIKTESTVYLQDVENEDYMQRDQDVVIYKD